jgi:hypothetical protein
MRNINRVSGSPSIDGKGWRQMLRADKSTDDAQDLTSAAVADIQPLAERSPLMS